MIEFFPFFLKLVSIIQNSWKNEILFSNFWFGTRILSTYIRETGCWLILRGTSGFLGIKNLIWFLSTKARKRAPDSKFLRVVMFSFFASLSFFFRTSFINCKVIFTNAFWFRTSPVLDSYEGEWTIFRTFCVFADLF